ncbi:hypothetical protein SAMD00019534_050490 [Acytostelium subglobosum LB1]|uniref:hypothetical protein n=1 Tax=Acytostelium subglobosum LB1 TaxID=1410327 RepID=UPI000644B75A|nr:hypothetical protein SAMD00019534_050490 [Acytostelium subglobosum LB1]GAM21874.1 hypothetical protein SAMD00019534_050490 [Acytostelium subglobosum LB1]|eukprot:XP_012754974.1 hypothetical protein SAMD00019534_050490 [Acytostelium subglobosum LB1]
MLSLVVASLLLVTVVVMISMTLAFFTSLLTVLIPLTFILALLIFILRLRFIQRRRPDSQYTVAFFHPYCAAGGGGERVLWCSVKSIQDEYPHVKCVVYTGDTVSDQQIYDKIKNQFDIHLNRDNLEFVRLHQRRFVEASMYPRFTLVGQSLGSMLLGWEALNLLNPHVFIDTMGYAFTYPIFRLLGGCKVACYVHYPVVSTDMMSRVGQAAHNNNQAISGNRTLATGKLIYYRVFSWVYCLVGNFAQIVFVNGTWTGNHIAHLWRMKIGVNGLHLLYPPVDTRTRKQLALNWMGRKNIVLSIAQFRPEKDHTLQLNTLHYILTKYPEHRNNIKFVLVGSTRDQDDRDRVEALKTLADELEIADHLEINVGVSAQHLNQLLNEASVGIHTMWAEHFGIGVVELMAAGVIPVAHNSGGPKEDIVKHNETGFLAVTKEEYGDYIHDILSSKVKYIEMQRAARESTDRFSEENYIVQFIEKISPLLPQSEKKHK